MICKFCGNVIEDSSDFCFICGQKVVEETPEYTPADDIFEQTEDVATEAATEEKAAEAPVEVPVAAPAAAESLAAYANAFDSSTLPQGTPIYAQTAPVYAHQVFIQQLPAQQPAVPFVQVNGKNLNGKGSGNPDEASGAVKFFSAFFAITFILQFISWIWQSNAKKRGYMNKAEQILNATMVGLCIFMVIVCFVLVKSFML